MRKLILWVFILLVLTWGGFQYWPVTVHIFGSTPEEDFSIRMPLKDKKRLEFFFRDVCFLNAWAYTLIGTKPMSIHQYRKPWAAILKEITHPDFKEILFDCFWPPHLQKINYLFTPEQLKTKLGWETLEKYFCYFPHSRFVLYTSDPYDDGIVILTLIDKIKFIKTVKQYLEDFQEVLQKQTVSPEEFLDNGKLRRFLKGLSHDGFLGTLLGFGRANAWLYYKCRDIDPQEWPMASPWAAEEIVNLEKLNKKALSFQPWDLSDLFYPRFACDSESEETKQLQQIYREERDKIIKYYEGKDVVEATLSLFNRRLDERSAVLPDSGGRR